MPIPRPPKDIAHDVRSPLSIIQMTAETMMEGASPEQLEGLETILSQVQKISELTREIASLPAVL